MARTSKRPKYRRQKRADKPDLAFLELRGQRLYLGEYDSDKSRAEYRRLIAEWAGAGGSLPVPQDDISVSEVVIRFWGHVTTHYRRQDGTATSEVANYRTTLKVLRELYGHTKAGEFGPRGLKAIRDELIQRSLSRKGHRRGSLRGAASHLRRKVPHHLRASAPEDQRSPGSFHSLWRSAFRLSSLAVL